MHFTYEKVDKESLYQGDVLRRTPKLDALLQEVHPHYFQKKRYGHFLVLTQTCDLVRREGTICKSPYISIAAARPASDVVSKEITRLQRSEIEKTLRFCSEKTRPKVDQFVERLLNNNEAGYFFLAAEELKGLKEDHCAILRLSIALKVDHYETLLESKIIQLKESFQHKLGHLLGAMYSRVGTEDYVPDHCDESKFRELVKNLVERDRDDFIWLESDLHKKVLKQLEQLKPDDLNSEKLKDCIAEHQQQKEARRQSHLDLIGAEMISLKIDESIVNKLKQRLSNNSAFRAQIR